jgi:hypothetical protein
VRQEDAQWLAPELRAERVHGHDGGQRQVVRSSRSPSRAGGSSASTSSPTRRGSRRSTSPARAAEGHRRRGHRASSSLVSELSRRGIFVTVLGCESQEERGRREPRFRADLVCACTVVVSFMAAVPFSLSLSSFVSTGPRRRSHPSQHRVQG